MAPAAQIPTAMLAGMVGEHDTRPSVVVPSCVRRGAAVLFQL
jgi:hypothetical protein